MKKDICVKIDNLPITQVKKTQFIGVKIYCNLTWKEYVSYISGKIAKITNGVGIPTKARQYLNKIIISLCNTFV